MKVQEDLVWNKHTGELIGFVDLGSNEINESLLQDNQKLANHIMVFMVKSIKNPLSYSFANFATDWASSAQIFSLFWKAVSILELTCNLKVFATVSDGASVNRKFIQMNQVSLIFLLFILLVFGLWLNLNYMFSVSYLSSMLFIYIYIQNTFLYIAWLLLFLIASFIITSFCYCFKT